MLNTASIDIALTNKADDAQRDGDAAAAKLQFLSQRTEEAVKRELGAAVGGAVRHTHFPCKSATSLYITQANTLPLKFLFLFLSRMSRD